MITFVTHNVSNNELSQIYPKPYKTFVYNNYCLSRFIPYDGHQQYIYFLQDDDWCSSYLGMLPNGQGLWLNESCYDHGTVVHELLHALGNY